MHTTPDENDPMNGATPEAPLDPDLLARERRLMFGLEGHLTLERIARDVAHPHTSPQQIAEWIAPLAAPGTPGALGYDCFADLVQRLVSDAESRERVAAGLARCARDHTYVAKECETAIHALGGEPEAPIRPLREPASRLESVAAEASRALAARGIAARVTTKTTFAIEGLAPEDAERVVDLLEEATR